jgi:hypothetical protein
VIKIILLTITLLFAAPALAADDLWLSIGGVSHHQHKSPGTNEQHFGPGFHVGLSPNVRAVAQVFPNSKRIDSTFIGAALYAPWDLWSGDVFGTELRVRSGVMAGHLTGYALRGMWVAIPGISFETPHAAVDFLLAKEFQKDALVFGFNFRFRF